jgi:hypothetical protein
MSELLEQIEPVAAEVRKAVFADLERRVSKLVERSWSEIGPKISELAGALERADAWRVEDQQGAIHLKISCAILAMYRTLLPLFEERERVLDHLQAVLNAANFSRGMDAFLLDRFGISPDAPEDAWDTLRRNYMEKGRKRYGKAWVFEEGMKDHRRFFVNIRKCGFADFFLAHGAREVLYLLCASDYMWGDALEKYNIRFERPTTLAEGSDACRFQLFKVE